jgi:hypothetical protein
LAQRVSEAVEVSAEAVPSVLYDYYNPEANAAVLPLRFNVQ